DPGRARARARAVHDGHRLARAALLGAAACREVRADERDLRVDRGLLALAGARQAAPPPADGGSRARGHRGMEGRNTAGDGRRFVEGRGHMLTWDDIEQAGRRLADVAHRTPMLHSRQFDEASETTVYFKAENLQRGEDRKSVV